MFEVRSSNWLSRGGGTDPDPEPESVQRMYARDELVPLVVRDVLDILNTRDLHR